MLAADPRVRGWVSHTLGLAVLRRCCEALDPLGIDVMPLKGLWLQSCVYARPEERLITDVDVIVPEPRFDAAIVALERAGFLARQRNASEVALYAPGFELPIDLHRRLFMPGAFALPTHELFVRADPRARLAGASVRLPDPTDALCHLIGHFVKSRALPSSTSTRDFVEVMDRFALVPEQVAQRLDRAGMGRAARYALFEIGRRHAGLGEARARLRPDPIGDWIADACAHGLLGESPDAGSTVSRLRARLARSPAAGLVGFLLEPSLPSGAGALLQRVLSLRHDRGHGAPRAGEADR